jgi:hypothetical protein
MDHCAQYVYVMSMKATAADRDLVFRGATACLYFASLVAVVGHLTNSKLRPGNCHRERSAWQLGPPHPQITCAFLSDVFFPERVDVGFSAI